MRSWRFKTYLSIVLAIGFLVIPGRQVFAIGQASLSMTPATGIFEVGSTIDVSFVLDTGGEAVNAVRSDILFPADKLQVVNPAASTSFISIWVTAPRFSNTDGTISFEGGVPTPGVKTSSGVISTVTFRITSPGTALIKYATTSKVLRNDGEGTNILASTSTAAFTLKLPPPDGPVVRSISHGDTTKWYNNPSVQFTWDPIDTAAGYSYLFDQSPKTVPPETVTTTAISATVKAASDGQWYFHVRAKTDVWGGVTTFPVRIDATAPAAFEPKFDRAVITTDDQPVVRFVTTDSASGIEHYEMKIIAKGDIGGGTLFLEAASPVSLPAQIEGDYSLVVRAIDRAGNTMEGFHDFQVIGSGVSFYARVPFLRNPAIANLTLIVLLLVTITFFGILLWRRLRVRETFRHDLALLERDAQKKSAALQHELAELREAQQALFGAQPDILQPVPNNLPPMTGVAPSSSIQPQTPVTPPAVPPTPATPPASPPTTSSYPPIPPSTPIPTIFQ